MRRSLVAALCALTLVAAPFAAQADPASRIESPVTPVADEADEGFTWRPDPAETSAEEDLLWEPDEELVPTQRYGFTEDPMALEEPAEPVVVDGQTALPDPEPGAEVYNVPDDGIFDVVGGGFGHRIGMSQYGADGAGKAGLEHERILDFYYPGTDLETRAIGTIRIGITIDNDGVTRVAHRSGLRVSSGPGGTTYALPSDRSQWRVRATSSSTGGCVLEGRTGSTWAAYWPSGMSRACPVTFSSPTESTVDLFLPDGSQRIYRGSLTATYTGSTRLTTVNALPMQHYLRSVVAAEMPNWFHGEALRTQAVAARTYAERGAGGNQHYDTCDTTWCQAYRGRGVRTSSGGVSSYEYTSTTAAVDATNGEVLTYQFPNGVRLATTMYSSSNGGWAAPAGNGHDYMPAHADPYDDVAGNARHAYQAELPATSLQGRYGIHQVERIQIFTRDGHGEWGGRVLDARVEGYTSDGTYTWAYATGQGLMLTRYWPYWLDGMSSDYFTIVGGEQAEPERIAGENRYGTAAKVTEAWSPGINVVYVVSGANYPDALAAAARAGVYDAPVLLTEQDAIPDETDAALRRLAPSRLVVLGGSDAVSGTVLQDLRPYASTGSVQRVSGTDRYGTAAAIASYYPSGRSRVYLASGQNFPDALSAAAIAADQQVPLLLTRADRLDAATIEQLQRLAAGEVVVLGGDSVVSPTVAQQAASYTTSGTFRRLAGENRYQTSAEVAEEFPANVSPAYVASGETFPDALVGAALAGRQGVPIVLTKPDRVHAGTARALEHLQPGSMFVLGGPGAVQNSTLEALGAYLR